MKLQIYSMTVAAALAASWAWATTPPKPLPFAQRWPVERPISWGTKEDRLDIKPLPEPPVATKPAHNNWLANPSLPTRIACANY